MEVDGVDFYETPGQQVLDGAAVGEPGQASVTFSFTATGDVYEVGQCLSQRGWGVRRRPVPYMADTYVNGRRLGLLNSCSGPDTDYAEGPGFNLGRGTTRWRELGVRVGERVEVEVRLTADEAPVEGTDIRVGAGFWVADDVERVEAVPGVHVDRIQEAGGINCEFVRGVTTTLQPGNTLAVPIVSGEGPRLVNFRVGAKSEVTLLGGRGGPQSLINRGGTASTGTTVVRPRQGDELQVQLERSRGPQEVWVAVYRPAL